MEEQVPPRQKACAAICGRVASQVASWPTPVEMVQIALACSTRQPAELLQFMFSRGLARAATAKAADLAVKEEEWAALFGTASRPSGVGAVGALQREPELQEGVLKIQNALRCTVAETAQGQAWARPWTRTAAFLAMHTDEHEQLITHSVGNIVRADCRRLDDLRAEIEDSNWDTVLLASVVSALAAAVQ
jgi:hypothetical protein